MDSNGIQGWILGNIVPILLCVIGLVILAGAKKGNWSGTMSTGGIAIIGIIFIVGAGAIVAFSGELANIVFPDGGGNGGGQHGGNGGG